MLRAVFLIALGAVLLESNQALKISNAPPYPSADASSVHAVVKSREAARSVAPASIRVVDTISDVSSDETVCAHAKFEDKVNTTGWAFLDIQTLAVCSDEVQAFAAGFLEAHTSYVRIYQTAINFGAKAPLASKVFDYVQQHQTYVKAQVAANPSDAYWHQVGLVDQQFQGLYAGYSAVAPAGMNLTAMQLWVITAGNDLEDVAGALGLDSLSQTGEHIGFDTHGHCSALVKLLADGSDLFISQDTWSSFSSMLRVYKNYNFSFTSAGPGSKPIAAQTMSFSSYPGCIYSGDDFYALSSGLVTQETTIGNSNSSLNKFVVPETVLEFTRNIVCNRLAHTAPEWVDCFKQHNSGTYNNEWMVLDYKLFESGKPLVPNTFWVLDQVPGHVEAADLSAYLQEHKYFASYNVAFFPRIFNISGGNEMVAKYGEWFSHDYTARALIFARDQPKVVDIKSMMKLMRYNDFQHDPLSRCDCKPFPYSSENAIACRDDLDPANGTYPFPALGHRNHAATDSKLTSSTLFKKGQVWTISSPTYDQQPVFKWSTSGFDNVAHEGMPDVYDFPWITVSF